jgi:hypothetical protein
MPICIPAGAFFSTRLVTATYLSISALQSPRLERCLHLGIAELGERRLVDLHIAAAGIGERLQFLAERLHRVVPELVEVGVGAGQNGRVAAAKVQRAGAGDGDLRNELGVSADIGEIRHVDRMAPAHPAVDHRDRLASALARCAALRVLAADRIDAEVAELAVEEAVIGAAAEFAVGRKLQPNALLQRERVLDGLVFGFGQGRLVNFATREFRPLVEQGLGAQQAADVLGAERRLDLG